MADRKVKSKKHVPIDRKDDPDLYERMDRLIEAHHPHLYDGEANIAIVWRKGWKRSKAAHSHIVLGKCKKASDFDLAFASFDFIIMLNVDAWKKLDEKQRDALLDHELCHAWGDEKEDKNKDTFWAWSIRRHDIEEFRDVVQRHGVYMKDVEDFVRDAVAASRRTTLFDLFDQAINAGTQSTAAPATLPIQKRDAS